MASSSGSIKTSSRAETSYRKKFTEITPSQQTDRLDHIRKIEGIWRQPLGSIIPPSIKPPGDAPDWGISLLHSLLQLSRLTNFTDNVGAKLEEAVQQRAAGRTETYLSYIDCDSVHTHINEARLKVARAGRAEIKAAKRSEQDEARRRRVHAQQKAKGKPNVTQKKPNAKRKTPVPSSSNSEVPAAPNIPTTPAAQTSSTAKSRSTAADILAAPAKRAHNDDGDDEERLLAMELERAECAYHAAQERAKIADLKLKQEYRRQAKKEAPV
jgi:hypothetical protein